MSHIAAAAAMSTGEVYGVVADSPRILVADDTADVFPVVAGDLHDVDLLHAVVVGGDDGRNQLFAGTFKGRLGALACGGGFLEAFPDFSVVGCHDTHDATPIGRSAGQAKMRDQAAEVPGRDLMPHCVE